MDFRTLKAKAKNVTEMHLAVLSPTPGDVHLASDIEKLQNEIEYKEKTLDVFIQHVLSSLDANIDDARLVMDQKRPAHQSYHLSVCALWLQLKSIEGMSVPSLVTFLHTYQLQRLRMTHPNLTDDLIEMEQQHLINPRGSRLTHFHICAASDEFSLNVDSYVGFLLFSYDNQSKFILNGHHCQRGDIIIKQTRALSHAQTSQRGVYDALFKWYFNRTIDEKVFGVGFFYSNRKWRFDSISCSDGELLTYEYQLLDMYLLTHWLTRFTIPHNVQEMEVHVKDVLLKQYEVVSKRLNDQQNRDLASRWSEFVGSDVKDLWIAIQQLMQTTEKQINSILKQTERKRQTSHST